MRVSFTFNSKYYILLNVRQTNKVFSVKYNAKINMRVSFIFKQKYSTIKNVR